MIFRTRQLNSCKRARMVLVFIAVSTLCASPLLHAQVSQARVTQAELLLQENPVESLKQLDLYLTEAERLDSITLANDIAQTIGTYHINGGNHQLAMPYLEKALNYAFQDSNAFQIAAAQDNLAIGYSRSGEPRKAIDYRLKSLDFYQRVDSFWHEGLAQLYLGYFYKQAGDLNEAIRRYSACDSIGRFLNRVDLQIWAKGSLGTALRAAGDPRAALENLQAVKQLAIEIGDTKSHLVTLQNIGNCYVSLNEHTNSLAYLDSAITLASQRTDTFTIMLSQVSAITSLIRLDRIAEAQERIDATRSMALATGNKEVEAHLGVHQASVYLYHKENQKAYDLLKSTIPIADSLEMKELLHEYYKELAAVSFVIGKVDEGYLYLATYDSLKRINMVVDERSLKNLLEVKRRAEELQDHSEDLTSAIEKERSHKLGLVLFASLSLVGLLSLVWFFTRYRRKRKLERAALVEKQHTLRVEKDAIERALLVEKETAQRLLDSTQQELEQLTADNDSLRMKIDEYQNWLGVHGYVHIVLDRAELDVDKLIETTGVHFTRTDKETIESLFSDPFLERKERAARLFISDSSMKDRLTKLLQLLDVQTAPEIPIKVSQLIISQEIKKTRTDLIDYLNSRIPPLRGW